MAYQSGKYGQATPSVPFSKAAPAASGGGIKGTGGGGGGGSRVDPSTIVTEGGKPIIYTSGGQKYYKTVGGQKIDIETKQSTGVYKDVVTSVKEDRVTLKTPSGSRILYPSTIATKTPIASKSIGEQIARKYSGLMGGRFKVSTQKDILITEEGGRKTGTAGFIPMTQRSTGEQYQRQTETVFNIPSSATYQEDSKRKLSPYEVLEFTPSSSSMREWKPEYEAGTYGETSKTIKAGGRDINIITGTYGTRPAVFQTEQNLFKIRYAAPSTFFFAKGALGRGKQIASSPVKYAAGVGAFTLLAAASPFAATAVGVGMGTKWVYDTVRSPKPFAEELGTIAPDILIYGKAAKGGAKMGKPFRTKFYARQMKAYQFRKTQRGYKVKIDPSVWNDYSRPIKIIRRSTWGKSQLKSMQQRYGTFKPTGSFKVTKAKIWTDTKSGALSKTQTQFKPKGYDPNYKPPAISTQRIPSTKGIKKFKPQLTSRTTKVEGGKTQIQLYDVRQKISEGLRPKGKWKPSTSTQTILDTRFRYKSSPSNLIKNLQDFKFRYKPISKSYKKIITTPRTQTGYVGLYLDPITPYLVERAGTKTTGGFDIFERYGGDYYTRRPRFNMPDLPDRFKGDTKTGEDTFVGTLFEGEGGEGGRLLSGSRSRTYTRRRNKLDPIVDKLPKIKIGDALDPLVDTTPAQIPQQRQRQKQRQDQILVNIPRQITTPIETGRRPPRQIEERPPEIPPDIIPPDLWLPKSKDKKKRGLFDVSIAPQFNTKYFASVEATAFNIKGKKPSKQKIAMGLSLRPIVRG